MTAQRRLRAVPENAGRTVLYVRVSATMGREGDEFHSPAMQTRAMRDLIARRGLVEAAVVEDIDVSGRTFERAGIQRVLEMARAREIDVVALYDLSRLGRNTAESLRTIAELRDLGVSVVSTVEQIDDTPEGQFQLGVFLGMAQLYSDQIGRRWRQVIAHRAEQGLFHGSVPPTGYRRAGRSIEPDPALAPAVREVFRRYAAGERIWHIAQSWRTSTGRRTAYVVLKRMLRNPVYVGRVQVGGQVHPGQHEPLVPEATWRRVQRRLEEDSRTPARRLAVANPLAGLVVCDDCSRPLQMHFDKRRVVGGAAVLQCRGARELRDCRGPGSPLLDEVVDKVLSEVEAEASRLTVDMAGAHARAAARRARAVVDVRALRKEIASTEAALGRLAADRARRVITEGEMQAAAGLLRGELDRLHALLADSERVKETRTVERTVSAARGLRRHWSRMSPAQRNRALRDVGVWQVRVGRAASYRQPVGERTEVRFVGD